MRSLMVFLLASLVALPALAQRGADQFANLTLVTNAADPASGIAVVVRFEDDAVVIRGRSLLKYIRDTSITGAEYRRATPASKAPGQNDASHWLAIAADGDTTLLRLNEHDYRMVLVAFEGRIGIRVTTRELLP